MYKSNKVAFTLSFLATSIPLYMMLKALNINTFFVIPISLLIGGIIFALVPKSLDEISSRETGNNQHGDSKFTTVPEQKNIYEYVKEGEEKKPGIVVGRENGYWIVDTSDKSATLLAPPGSLKTTGLIIPTILYNARVNKNTKGKGASILSTDLKGEELIKTGAFLEENGYTCAYLDFSSPMSSYFFNLMFNVNRHMDTYITTNNEEEKLLSYAKAERYAKILSESIVDNIETTSKSDAGAYFTESAKGLITGIVLLVSQYGQLNQKHIISVFKLIIELNGLSERKSPIGQQKSKLSELLQYIDNDRIINYVGPAMSADTRQSMNVFSSALSNLVKFIDAELEQMICSHSQELSDFNFTEKPTAIFLICPDENPTRNFFASLFIRYMMNDLIEQARKTDNVLKRQVLCLWDEFGNMPSIKNMDTLISAARSRGIRFILALQSMAQIKKNYNETMSEIIFDSAQILIFTRMSPTAYKTAKSLSDSLGTKTIMSGSVSKGNGRSTTLQMMGKELLAPSEIIRLKQGTFIVVQSGYNPSKLQLPHFTTYTPDYEQYKPTRHNDVVVIDYLSIEEVKQMFVKKSTDTTTLKVGMFD